jgi:hypothetical protein
LGVVEPLDRGPHLVRNRPDVVERHFGRGLESWRRESLRASLLPSKVILREGRPLARRLKRGRRITITHSNGTRLDLGLAGGRPFIDDGEVDQKDLANGWMGATVPGGYLVVALDPRVAEGRLISNLPSHTKGRIISGITWVFREGRLVQYDIKTGRDLFEKPYRTAGRERDRPAILYVGLNAEIHEFPQAEDQALGTLGVDIGHNDDFGGPTRGSFRQYVLIRGADLFIDDQRVRFSRRRG